MQPAWRAAEPPPYRARRGRSPRRHPSPRVSSSLVGQHAGAALAQFGKPRLDIAEGAGRKLQFAGAACILDIYYYAPKQGAEPVATHVDARTPEGRDANVDSCVNALRR